MDATPDLRPDDEPAPILAAETAGWIVMWAEQGGRLRISEIFANCEDAQQARFNPPEDSWDYRATFFFTGSGGEQTFDC